MTRRVPVLFTIVVAVLMLVLSACSSGDDSKTKGLGAAEPGKAPSASQTPAGEIVAVGDLPQGIVYDAKTDLLAVAVRNPFRLLLLDPTTLETKKSVPLPGKVRHLQLAGDGGPVLVPSESANQIIEVSLPDGETRSTDVQRQPHDAAGAENGDLVVGNEFSGSISLVRDGAVLETISDLDQPGGVITSGEIAAVVDVGDFSVSTYDLDSMTRTGRVAAGRGPTHGVLVGDDRMAVTDTRGDQVLVYTLDPLEKVGAVDLAGKPYGITSDPDSETVWVTLTTKNELVGFDVSGDTPRVISTYPTPRQADTVAVDPGSTTLWVTGTADGVVQRITR